MLEDLCANNDCALGDSGRPECFRKPEDWDKLHEHCEMDEGRPVNYRQHDFVSPFNSPDGMWQLERK